MRGCASAAACSSPAAFCCSRRSASTTCRATGSRPRSGARSRTATSSCCTRARPARASAAHTIRQTYVRDELAGGLRRRRLPPGRRRRPARHPPAPQTRRTACIARDVRAAPCARLARAARGPTARRRRALRCSRSRVYAVRAIGWPLIGGRDLDEYLYGYVQFLDWHPLLPWSMLFRTPVHADRRRRRARRRAAGCFAEPLMAVLFAGVGRRLGRGGARVRRARSAARRGRAARLPGLRPDVPRALERAALRGGVRALGIARRARGANSRRPRASRSSGLGVALLALIRPGNAVLLAFVLFPLRPAGTLARQRDVGPARSSSPRSSRSSRGRCSTAFASATTRSRAAATRSSLSIARSSPTRSSRRTTAPLAAARDGGPAATC